MNGNKSNKVSRKPKKSPSYWEGFHAKPSDDCPYGENMALERADWLKGRAAGPKKKKRDWIGWEGPPQKVPKSEKVTFKYHDRATYAVFERNEIIAKIKYETLKIRDVKTGAIKNVTLYNLECRWIQHSSGLRCQLCNAFSPEMWTVLKTSVGKVILCDRCKRNSIDLRRDELIQNGYVKTTGMVESNKSRH